jgi:DNA-binding LacI/PurR family transcriptional regulator
VLYTFVAVVIVVISVTGGSVDHGGPEGHKNILYVKDVVSQSTGETVHGFLESMKNTNLQADESSVFVTDRSLEGGGKAVDDIIESGKKSSVLIFGDNITVVGGLNRLKKIGFKVPGDVAVIGYNKTISSLYLPYPTPSIITRTKGPRRPFQRGFF